MLGVQATAFPAGHEAEEIRALWKAAHQKVLLDEAWLASLLGRTRPALTLLHPASLEVSHPWYRKGHHSISRLRQGHDWIGGRR